MLSGLRTSMNVARRGHDLFAELRASMNVLIRWSLGSCLHWWLVSLVGFACIWIEQAVGHGFKAERKGVLSSLEKHHYCLHPTRQHRDSHDDCSRKHVRVSVKWVKKVSRINAIFLPTGKEQVRLPGSAFPCYMYLSIYLLLGQGWYGHWHWHSTGLPQQTRWAAFISVFFLSSEKEQGGI